MSPLRSRALSAVCLAALLAAAPAPPAAGEEADPQNDPCAEADELLELRQLALAEEWYLELLAVRPAPECARAGYDATTEQQRKAAERLAAGKDLAALGTDEARKEARGLYLDAIRMDGSLAAASAALKALEEGSKESHGFWQIALKPLDTFTARLTDWGKQLGILLAALAVAVVLLWIVAKLVVKVRSWWPRDRGVRIVLQKVSDPSEQMKIGKDLRARLADELDLASAAATGMRQVEGASAEINIVDALPKEAKVIGPLIEWLRRPLEYRVVGFAHTPSGKPTQKAALSLIITDARNKVIHAQRFESPVGAEKEAYLALTVDAAAWTLFRFRQLRRPLAPADTLHVMGARSWRSYASYRHGVLADGDERKSGFFHEALAEDHRNVAALVSLGSLQTKRLKEEYDQGIRHLELAQFLLKLGLGIQPEDSELSKEEARRMACTPARRRRWVRGRLLAVKGMRVDPLWYQATYKLAVAYMHRFAAEEDESKLPTHDRSEDLDACIRTSMELAQAIGATRLTLRSWRRWAVRRKDRCSLQQMFDHDEGYLLGVLAGSLASREWSSQKPLVPAGASPRDLWAWLAELDPENEKRRPPARELVDKLRPAAEFATFEMHYNLACFYSRARETDESVRWLRTAFQHYRCGKLKEDIEWAREDPTLKPVRQGRKLEFAKLMKDAEKRLPADSPTASSYPPNDWQREIPPPATAATAQD